MTDGNELFERYLDGDGTVFDEIVRLYRESLIFFVMRYVKSPSVAEDIAEDAFVELFIHKDRYNFSCSLKTYIYTIARNLAVNYIRRRKFLTDEEPDIEMRSEEEALEERVIRTEREHALYRTLDKLPEDYRNALYLVYIEDMSYEDAGRVLKKNRKQIENLVFRGKSAAKKILEKEGVTT